MRSPWLLPLVVLMLGLGSTASPMVDVIVDPPRDPEAARTNWRWIGVTRLQQQGCPAPIEGDGWTTAPLFPTSDVVPPPPGEVPDPDAIAPALSRFCVYENSGVDPAKPRLAEGWRLIKLDRDFMGAMPSGGVLDSAFSPQLIDQFLSQAGQVKLPIVPGRKQVRLAIVDTAATREVGAENHPGTSVHGFTLLNLARNLLCDAGGNCVAKVTSRLALGWECFDADQRDSTTVEGTPCRNPIDGGLYGLPTDLAQAINMEVRNWRDVDHEKKLVMNLSIAWAPIFGGTEAVADMPAGALAVYSAIQHAVCEGAVVIAASGNRSFGPTAEPGPMLPAYWEQKPALGPAQCQALGVVPNPANFPVAGASPYRPLVFGVGGVRAGDGSLFNSRTASEPRLVAFGDHAKGLTSGTLGNGPTPTLAAGTSIASLVVSATAAAVWYYDDTRKPYQVMNTIYDVSRPLGKIAAFCQGGTSCATLEVKRVSLCSVVSSTGGPVAPAACGSPHPLDLAAVDLSGITFAETVKLGDLGQTSGPIPVCNMERLHHGPDAPDDPCPHWQYNPRNPDRGTSPQPGAGGTCTTCPYDPATATLYIEIDSDFVGEVEGGVLKCGDDTWGLGLPPMGANATVQVNEVACPVTEPILLSFAVDDGTSSTSPVLAIEP